MGRAVAEVDDALALDRIEEHFHLPEAECRRCRLIDGDALILGMSPAAGQKTPKMTLAYP